VTLSENAGGYVRVTIAGAFTGDDGDSVSLYDETTESMYTGIVTNSSGDPIIVTDIPWVAGMSFTYMNNNTEFAGYYVEVRLTVKGVLEPLTLFATPNSFGIADVDVSVLLRIKTRPTKDGDYSETLMKEAVKSGRFSMEYREAWYGSDEEWYPEGGSVSPPSEEILWYYAECMRSIEQGSNLSEYVANEDNDAPFLNSFEQPVYFTGLPFDISFIMPELTEVSPESDITITLKIYNSSNVQLGADIVETVSAEGLEGYVVSLTIASASIPEGAAYLTAEITTE
jgi:hypothetical protein